MCKGRATDVQVTCKGRARDVQVICKGRASELEVMCKGRARDVQVRCKRRAGDVDGQLDSKHTRRIEQSPAAFGGDDAVRSEGRGSLCSTAVQRVKTTDETVEEDGSSRAHNPCTAAYGRRSRVERTLLLCFAVVQDLRRMKFAVVRGSRVGPETCIYALGNFAVVRGRKVGPETWICADGNFAVVLGSKVGPETQKLCCSAWK